MNSIVKKYDTINKGCKIRLGIDEVIKSKLTKMGADIEDANFCTRILLIEPKGSHTYRFIVQGHCNLQVVFQLVCQWV